MRIAFAQNYSIEDDDGLVRRQITTSHATCNITNQFNRNAEMDSHKVCLMGLSLKSGDRRQSIRIVTVFDCNGPPNPDFKIDRQCVNPDAVAKNRAFACGVINNRRNATASHDQIQACNFSVNFDTGLCYICGVSRESYFFYACNISDFSQLVFFLYIWFEFRLSFYTDFSEKKSHNSEKVSDTSNGACQALAIAGGWANRKFVNMNHKQLKKIIDKCESEIRNEKNPRKKKILVKQLQDDFTNMVSCVLGLTVGQHAQDFKNLYVICFVWYFLPYREENKLCFALYCAL